MDLRLPVVMLEQLAQVVHAPAVVDPGGRGLQVPRDLSVCGFDDTPIASHIFPALTTVRQPTAEMGRLAT